MFVCKTNHLGFGHEFLWHMPLVIVVVSLVGVGSYNTYLKDVLLQKFFMSKTLLEVAQYSTQVCVSTHCKFFGTLFLEPRMYMIGNI